MAANLKRISIVQLFGFLIAALLLTAPDASAFMFSTDGGSLRVAFPAALYASDANGRIVKVVSRGARVPGGGTIADLGTPAVGIDGSVIFGAEVRGEGGGLGWRIFRADPNAHGGVWITGALGDSETTAKCRPALKTDPQPVASEDGSIVFSASDQVGHSALFRYANGRLNCLVRAGDRTAEGSLIAAVGFGSAVSAADGSVMFGASLAPDRDAARLPDTRNAILLAAPGSAAREIAVEGSRAEDGKRYGRHFGLPSISNSSGGVLVSFTNGDRAGGSLFVGTAKHPQRTISTGVATGGLTLTYLSDGRPSVDEDGTVAIRAAGGARAMILVVRAGEPVVIARDDDRVGGMTAQLADPAALQAGRLYVEAADAEDRDHVLSISTAEPPRTVTPNQETASIVSGAVSVFPYSLNVNRKGGVAFLEE